MKHIIVIISAASLAEISVILWDECTMSDRRILESVHRLFCTVNPSMMHENTFFPGVLIIFGGDFKQTLPIIEGVSDRAVYEYTIKGSSIWKTVEVSQLLLFIFK